MNKPHVAVVANDQETRQLASNLLTSDDFSVVTYESGASALEVADHGVDVVCIDLALTDMPVAEFAHALRDRGCEAPVIVIESGAEDPEGRERALSQAFDVVAKPLDADRLRRVVSHAFELATLRAEVRRLRETLSPPPGSSQPPAIEPHSGVQRVASPASASAVPGAEGTTEEVIPLRELERRAIGQALKVARGSVKEAARLLGMGRATLYRRLTESEEWTAIREERARKHSEGAAA